LGKWAIDSSSQVTLEAWPPASSGAAEAREEAFVHAEDARDVRRLRCRIPLIDLIGAAEQDAVGTWKHVAVAKVRVADLRLRLEDDQLATHRVKLLVVEQVAR